MKFSQLPVGQRFEYEGTAFCKVTPLLASEEHGNAQRMIPRSAAITPLDGTAPTPTEPPSDRSISLAQAITAIEVYHAECLALLLPGNDETRARLDQARIRILEHLHEL